MLLVFVRQIPTARIWFEAANKLFDHFVLGCENGKGSGGGSANASVDLSLLKNYLDIDQRFSEARCSKVFPLAIARYQENLPSHYTKKYHQTKVTQRDATQRKSVNRDRSRVHCRTTVRVFIFACTYLHSFVRLFTLNWGAR